MTNFSNSGARLISKDPRIFTIGWVGLLSGLILCNIGVLVETSGKLDSDFAEVNYGRKLGFIAREYGRLSGGEVVYLVLIGYVVFFVSGVSLLFAYEGSQLYQWMLLFAGLLVVSNSTVMAGWDPGRLSILWISVTKGALGLMISAIGLGITDFGPSLWNWLGKGFLLSGIAATSLSFPIGVVCVQTLATFLPCLVLHLSGLFLEACAGAVFIWVFHSQPSPTTEDEESSVLLSQ